MKQRLITLLLLVISIGCEPEQKEAVYLIGHSPEDTCFVESFPDNYKLITWFQDTLYHQCGIEVLISNKDSVLAKDLTIQAEGAKTLHYQNHYNKFVIQPHSNIVKLSAAKDGKQILSKSFQAVNLPYPELTISSNDVLIQEIDSSNTSVQLNLIQSNKRLRRILPYDCRYGFKHISILNEDNSKLYLPTVKDQQIDITKIINESSTEDRLTFIIDSVYRVNYRNEEFALSPNQLKVTLMIKK